MKINTTKLTFLCSFILALFANIALAQIQTPLDSGLRFVEDKYEEWGLERQDIADLAVQNMYPSKNNGVTHIYFVQRHQGIEVYNAITSVHVTPKGDIHNIGQRFVASIASKINTTTPSIDAANALRAALQHLGLTTEHTPRMIERISSHEVVFAKSDFAHTNVNVKLRFQPMTDGTVRLAWDMAIDQLDRNDYWSVRIDAQTGDLISKNNWMVKCQFVDNPYHRHDEHCTAHKETATPSVKEVLKTESKTINAALAGSYNVFGELIGTMNSPFESPIHGDRNLLVDPFDVGASPYGWHDTNGSDGAEYTITRGNNVHAYLDLNNSSNPTGEPDGGEGLVFDFPYNPNNEPEDQRDMAVTNLFYMVNSMHDFTYHFGLDAEAGAFQANNYGGSTVGNNDYVLAEAQDGNGNVADGNINNANFATPTDGNNGVMQMYLWDQAGGKLLTVTEPTDLAGGYETGSASYGPAVDDTPISGQVVLAQDGSSESTFGCNSLLNEDVAGKVVMFDRGGCFFEEKTLNAEAKGAIAAIICNFENSPMGMAGGVDGQEPTIPTVSLSSVNCSLLKSVLNNGLFVTIQLPTTSGPVLLDGDLDNGIIAHEYGHGVSNRLTGGPFAAGCLGNAEQMGEGWSDFFTLALSIKEGDTGEMRRGIGTYVERQETNGSGIRPLPYSTNMEVNNHTYDDVIRFSGSVHSVGAVWNQMLWDMYWALVDEHGFDIDKTNAAAGNNIAVQLVMDGMKLQPCSPGFVDGRDAILAADILNNEGANQCLIWSTFARRGLGYYADQGSSNSDSDGIADFEPLPTCIKELKVKKVVTAIANPGEEIDYTITVTNHKDEAVTNVVVTDIIPDGCTYVASSASNDGTSTGGTINWDLGTMESGDEIILTYKSLTDGSKGSVEIFGDDFENQTVSANQWVSLSLDPTFDDNWAYTNAGELANSGTGFYAVDNVSVESDQVLLLTEPIEVNVAQPVLRFYHSFATPSGTDGGFLQFSRDGGISWADIRDDFFKNTYTGPVSYQTFTIPFQQAYSGNSNGYVDSYVDLSEYAGETLVFRWRFGTDDGNPADANIYTGWFIDDVAYVDLLSYNGEVCVTSSEEDNVCAVAINRGTVMNEVPLAVENIIDESLGMTVFPNPASNYLTINLVSEYTETANLSILSLDGRTVHQNTIQTNGGTQNETIKVSNLAAGFYFVRITTPRGIAIQKVVVE